MLWMTLTIACSILFMQTLRWSQHARGSLAWAAFVNYAFAAVFYLPLYKPAMIHSGAVVILGAVAGVLYVVNLYLMAAVIRGSGVALASATATLAVVVPVLVSILGGDPWIEKTPGLAIALLACPLLVLARADQNGAVPSTHDAKRMIWMILLFVSIGIEMSFFKIARNVGADGFERAFLPALFAAALAASLGPVLAAGRRACGRSDLMRGLLLGGSNICANYAFAMTLMDLSGTVAFPVRHIGGVVGTTVLGYFVWRERVNRFGLAGIGLGLTAAVLLSVGAGSPIAVAPGP